MRVHLFLFEKESIKVGREAFSDLTCLLVYYTLYTVVNVRQLTIRKKTSKTYLHIWNPIWPFGFKMDFSTPKMSEWQKTSLRCSVLMSLFLSVSGQSIPLRSLLRNNETFSEYLMNSLSVPNTTAADLMKVKVRLGQVRCDGETERWHTAFRVWIVCRVAETHSF